LQRRRDPSGTKPSSAPAQKDAGAPDKNALIVALLKAWKEGRDATEAIDPLVFADGISMEERIRIIKELTEAIGSMQVVLKFVA
jgi:tetrahydromethanopterin S-methyltransferase subunit A